MPTLSVDQVLSGGELGFSFGLSDLLVLDTGNRHVLYALSRIEGVLVEVEISPDGTLTFVDSLSLTGDFAVGSDPVLGSIHLWDGGTSLSVSGLPASTGQMVTLSADGSLGAQTALAQAGPLISPVSLVANATALLVSGRDGGGLDLFGDSGSGFSFFSGVGDTTAAYLADVADSVAFRHAGTDFLATASATEDGLNLVQVTSTGLVQHDALGAAEGLPINTPVEIEAIQRMGETLLVSGAFDTSSISVVSLGGDGRMQIADHVLDGAETRFQGLSGLDTLVHGDFAFVAVGGADAGVSLFTVLPGGRLVHLDTLADDAATTLYRVSAIELATIGTRLEMLVSSAWESGVTRLGYDLSALGAVLVAGANGGTLTGTSGDDQIIGSDMADTLVGGDGQDIVADGAGQDVLTGGAGSDLFVLNADGQADAITDYERGADRLDLSAWDFLYDVSQVSITPTTDGAILSFGSETLSITASDGAALTASDFSNATILNVDRPPLLPVSQLLQGGPGADTLNGGWGPDTIVGAGGDDVLSGLAGDDSLSGGAGDDFLDGGSGADTLTGESGADTLVGGTGDDRLLGGIGDDVIYGDEYDWQGG